jgi:hypothetical protein
MTYDIDGDFENPGVTITVTIGGKTHVRDWWRGSNDIRDCWEMEPECYDWLRDIGLTDEQATEIVTEAENVGT